MAKGVRFWIPCKFLLPGVPPMLSTDPFIGRNGGLRSDRVLIAERAYPNMYYHGKKGFTIRGEEFIDDPSVVRKLVAKPGTLRFDPQEVVDLGYMSYDDITALGYKVRKPEKPVSLVPDSKERPSLYVPDLDVMTKDEIVDWCGENDVAVDVRLRKPELVERLRKQLGV